MGEGKSYQVIVAKSASIRYRELVLQYLFENFSFERATAIDEKIIRLAGSLSVKPYRGRKEKYLSEFSHNFRFILFKETSHLEIKIIYYISEEKSIVYVTDFFPTKMDPSRIRDNQG